MLSYGVSFLPVIDEKKRLVGLVTAKDAQRLININTGAQAGD
jgi:CBS domain-containing protein